jgi:hypothetical protein
MPLPRIDDLLDKLRGASEFSALDMASGYFATNLREEDRKKTAFKTHSHGLLEWVRMPMGLKNSGATYQRMLQQIMGPLMWESAMNYLDDVSIISKGTDHIDDLARVLKRLARWGVTMKLPKCMFSTHVLPFLGFVVLAGKGIRIDPAKVKAIVERSSPKTVTQVKSILGACNFLRKFIPSYSALISPWLDLIKGKKKRDSVEEGWEADPRCGAVFAALKAALVSAPVLAFPDFSRQFFLATDASQEQIGSVLFQVGPDGIERPIAYYSRTLSPAEKNYCISDLEALSVVASCRNFRKYILGSETVIITDHAALKALTH